MHYGTMIAGAECEAMPEDTVPSVEVDGTGASLRNPRGLALSFCSCHFPDFSLDSKP